MWKKKKSKQIDNDNLLVAEDTNDLLNINNNDTLLTEETNEELETIEINAEITTLINKLNAKLSDKYLPLIPNDNFFQHTISNPVAFSTNVVNQLLNNFNEFEATDRTDFYKSWYEKSSIPTLNTESILSVANLPEKYKTLNHKINQWICQTYLKHILTTNEISIFNLRNIYANMIVLDILKHNLLFQMYMEPDLADYFVFTLFATITPIQAMQITFNTDDLDEIFNEEDYLLLNEYLVLLNAHVASIHQNNETFADNLLKERLNLVNLVTNEIFTLAPIGSAIPLSTTITLTPKSLSGALQFGIYIREIKLGTFEINLNELAYDTNMVDDPNLYLAISLSQNELNIVLKYQLVGTNEYSEKYETYTYQFTMNSEDKKHYTQELLKMYERLWLKETIILNAKSLLDMPFAFNDLLLYGISNEELYLVHDLLVSWFYLINYNLTFKDNKINLKNYLIYNQNDAQSFKTYDLNNNRSFALNRIRNDWDLDYLTRGIQTQDAIKLVKLHRKSMKRWRRKLGAFKNENTKI